MHDTDLRAGVAGPAAQPVHRLSGRSFATPNQACVGGTRAVEVAAPEDDDVIDVVAVEIAGTGSHGGCRTPNVCDVCHTYVLGYVRRSLRRGHTCSHGERDGLHRLAHKK